MERQTIIACEDCNKGLRRCPENMSPEFQRNDKDLATEIEIEKNDLEDFLREHAGHKIGDITILDGPWSEESYLEPVKEMFYSAIDGNGRRMVVRCWRDEIDQPCRYEILPNRIKFWVIDIEAQVKEIDKQLRTEKPDIWDWQIRIFTAAMEHLLEQDKRFIKKELELGLPAMKDNGVIAPSNYHPLVYFCKLSDSFIKLLRHTVGFFNKESREAMERFIEEQNSVPDGVLALKVTLDFSVG